MQSKLIFYYSSNQIRIALHPDSFMFAQIKLIVISNQKIVSLVTFFK